MNNGLTLQTSAITNDIFAARNTVTTREHGPKPTATVLLDTSNLADGDKAGLAAFRDYTGFIGVVRSGDTWQVQVVSNARMTQANSLWTTSTTGNQTGVATVAKGKIWLRGVMDTNARKASFSYSLDGSSFTSLGTATDLNNDWHFFMGQRWALYCFATKKAGGSATFASFTQEGADK